MDTIGTKSVSSDSKLNSSHFHILRDLFGDNRAEWPIKRFGELFAEPEYFKKLQIRRPTILIGGRGTGKTTSLLSLKYQATLRRLESDGQNFSDQMYLGVFVRMNKNRALAFSGTAADQSTWSKAFAHYFNLLVCRELIDLAVWLQDRTEGQLSEESLGLISTELGVEVAKNELQLTKNIDLATAKLQIYVNNPGSVDKPTFSMPESVIKTTANRLANDGLTEGRMIFCCIDEYENLLDEQQAQINTYIKHAEPPISYKVGVRKNGMRSSKTISDDDALATPDDYEKIEIEFEGFDYFAQKAADLRLQRAREEGVPVPEVLNEFLEDLSLSQEASLLGADKAAALVRDELASVPLLAEAIAGKPDYETYLLKYAAESQQKTVRQLAEEWIANPDLWKNKLNNHGYASLFWLSKGRKGVRIRKYYCGTKTMLALAGGNIRYFLELIDSSINLQFELKDNATPSGLFTVSPQAQTMSASMVGRRRLNQLEGLAEQGVKLKRLVLAIGKVFFEYARNPAGRTPEVTQFILGGTASQQEAILPLLREGVAHLALEVAPRTKATTEVELRDDEYRLHPIFCAFFEISHRKKRRTTLDANNLNLLFEHPATAITNMLSGSTQADEEELPEQLAFFSEFFGGT